jgi:hypothetical protein
VRFLAPGLAAVHLASIHRVNLDDCFPENGAEELILRVRASVVSRPLTIRRPVLSFAGILAGVCRGPWAVGAR